MLRNSNKKARYAIAGRHETQKSDPWKWGNKKTLLFPFFHLLETYCMTRQHSPYFIPTTVRLL